MPDGPGASSDTRKTEGIHVARIRPFCAYTYARTSPDITPLVAPPYDVIDDAERAALLERSPHNVVALELAEGSMDPTVADNRYETAANLWRTWNKEGVVAQEGTPALYLLEQRFDLTGSRVRRRALIAEVGLHAFEEGVVLPHERTLPKALGDRFNLIESTGVNFSQVLGLLHDPEHSLGRAFDAVSDSPPTLTATDDAGAESIVWALKDDRLIARITEAFADQRIFIADGHHRYTVALAYRDKRREADEAAGRTPQDPDYDYVMMALVDMDDPELVVLPTHRVAIFDGRFDAAEFYSAMDRYFDVREATAKGMGDILGDVEAPAFLVRTHADDLPRLAVLRPDVDLDSEIPLRYSHAWKELDVAVLQELVLKPLFGIDPEKPETLDRLLFLSEADEAIEAADSAQSVAFVLRPTRMDQMRAVALAGDVMPQKSTYFYPKLLSGLLFRAIETQCE